MKRKPRDAHIVQVYAEDLRCRGPFQLWLMLEMVPNYFWQGAQTLPKQASEQLRLQVGRLFVVFVFCMHGFSMLVVFAT